ncbi:MAG: ATP-binding protein [Bacteroidales bacterium]|nr:ATP-binding protein [Bacteroidales bacterium]
MYRSKFLEYSIVLILTLFVQYTLNAQNTRLYFKTYSIVDGLSQNSVYCITQDKNDFIWLATGKGLNRFDGYDFVNYYHNPKDSTSISHSRVLDIEVDKQNRLWLATNAGVNCFDQTKDIFYHFKSDSSNSQTIWEDMVKDLFIDSQGYLWVGTRSGLNVSVLPVDSIKNLNTAIEFRRIPREDLSNNLIIRILEDKRGYIWVATTKGLNKINKSTFKVTQYYPDSSRSLQKANWISALEVNDDNSLWVATLSGLFLLKNGVFNSFNEHPFFIKNTSAKSIYSLKLDKFKRLWIGTFNQGVLMYNKKENTFNVYKGISSSIYSLANNHAYYLYIDKQSNLFVSTFAKGFAVANIFPVKFSLYLYNNRNIDNTNAIRSILYDKNEWLWLGLHNKGLYHLNLKTGRVEKFIFPSLINDNPLPTVKYIFKNNDSTLLLGTLTKGLYLFNSKTKKLIKELNYLENNQTNSIEAVFDIKKDKYGNLWIASWINGLFKLEKNTGKLIHYSMKNKNKFHLKNDNITSIYMSDNGEIWLTTWGGGINILNPKTGKLHIYNDSDKSPVKIPSNYCTIIHRDKSGVYWVGSTEGLFKLDEGAEKVEIFKSRSVIDNEIIYSIEEDNRANLWIGTNYGLNRFSTSNFSVLNYKETEGLPSNEYFIASSSKLSDGRLVFGSRNGLVVFHPDSILKPSSNVKVNITKFQISYKDIGVHTIYNGEQILTKSILSTDTLVLSYKNNILSFEFSACNFTKPQSIQYAFILEGFNDEWTYVNAHKRFAVYTNLEPGTYTLKIKASNIDGSWSPNIRKLVIIINTPFWKTKYFVFALFVAVVVLIILFFKIRHRYILKQKEQLENLVQKRTLELEQKNIELTGQKEEIALQKEELYTLTEQLQALNKNLENKIKLRTQKLNEALLKAESSEKLISSFLANFSHEIRTPMNAISGFTQLLSSGAIPDEKRQKYAGIINANIDTLLHLIENVMEVAKLHSGHYKFNKDYFSLASVCSSVYHELKPIFHKESVQVIMEFDSVKEMKLYSDIRSFRHIIYNLLENAMKYTEKGTVRVKCESNIYTKENREETFYPTADKADGFLTISVSDTGIGIKAENQKRIFNIFQKTEDSKNKIFRGTGLGLALVKELTEKLNGNIDLQSQVNKGTSIRIIIPLAIKRKIH